MNEAEGLNQSILEGPSGPEPFSPTTTDIGQMNQSVFDGTVGDRWFNSSQRRSSVKLSDFPNKYPEAPLDQTFFIHGSFAFRCHCNPVCCGVERFWHPMSLMSPFGLRFCCSFGRDFVHTKICGGSIRSQSTSQNHNATRIYFIRHRQSLRLCNASGYSHSYVQPR